MDELYEMYDEEPYYITSAFRIFDDVSDTDDCWSDEDDILSYDDMSDMEFLLEEEFWNQEHTDDKNIECG